MSPLYSYAAILALLALTLISVFYLRRHRNYWMADNTKKALTYHNATSYDDFPPGFRWGEKSRFNYTGKPKNAYVRSALYSIFFAGLVTVGLISTAAELTVQAAAPAVVVPMGALTQADGAWVSYVSQDRGAIKALYYDAEGKAKASAVYNVQVKNINAEEEPHWARICVDKSAAFTERTPRSERASCGKQEKVILYIPAK